MTSQNTDFFRMMPAAFFWEAVTGAMKSSVLQPNLEAIESIASRSVEAGGDITLLYAQGIQNFSQLLMDMGNQNLKCSVEAVRNLFKTEGMEAKLAYQTTASKEALERGLACMQKCFEQLNEQNIHASKSFQGYVGEVADGWKSSGDRMQKVG